MLKKLINIWQSFNITRAKVVPGLICFGVANEFLDPTDVPGFGRDRNKFGSFKIVISHFKGDVVFYYCYLVNSEGYEHISGTIRKTNVNELVRRIRRLDLIVEH